MAATKNALKAEQDSLETDLLEARILARELDLPLERILLDQLRAYKHALRVTRASLRQVLQDAAKGYYNV
jgi:hypothetical protein